MKKNVMFLSVLSVLAPVVASAQADGTFMGIIAYIGQILTMIVPILVTIAIIYFIWGVIKYVISGDEESKSKARSMIIYGIIGIAIIVGLWGFVRLLTNSLGVTNTSPFQAPQVGGSSNSNLNSNLNNNNQNNNSGAQN